MADTGNNTANSLRQISIIFLVHEELLVKTLLTQNHK